MFPFVTNTRERTVQSLVEVTKNEHKENGVYQKQSKKQSSILSINVFDFLGITEEWLYRIYLQNRFNMFTCLIDKGKVEGIKGDVVGVYLYYYMVF